jgi:hypothetical protein
MSKAHEKADVSPEMRTVVALRLGDARVVRYATTDHGVVIPIGTGR